MSSGNKPGWPDTFGPLPYNDMAVGTNKGVGPIYEQSWEQYAENPPHGAKGHRLSRNCDQCVENGS